MINPGEYGQPQERVTNVHCPIVGGYVTARLQVEGNPVNPQSGYADNTALVTLKNIGSNAFTVQFTGCNDYTSGPRENVGASKTVVPHGRTTFSITPRHAYLELRCLSGTSLASVQLASRLRWTPLAFDKTDAFYPPSLWRQKSPSSSAV